MRTKSKDQVKVRRQPGRGDRLIAHLRGGGDGDVPMSTDEIMALTREYACPNPLIPAKAPR